MILLDNEKLVIKKPEMELGTIDFSKLTFDDLSEAEKTFYKLKKKKKEWKVKLKW